MDIDVKTLFLLIAEAVGISLIWGLVLWRWIRNNENNRQKQEELSRKENELAIKEARAQLELEISEKRRQTEKLLDKREIEIDLKEKELHAIQDSQENDRAQISARLQELEAKRMEIDRQLGTVDNLRSHYRQKVQQMAGLTIDEAKNALIEDVKRECEDEIREMKKRMLDRSESDVQREAQGILLATMQRLSATPRHDITATIVPIPGEDMKGRIIGREGRNIKAFESATGTTLLIDETPDSVLVSSFDPVRREIARIALNRLMKDGRIHPGSIEEAVHLAEDEMKQSVIELGENALRKLHLNHVHPELVAILGRLHFRLSNNQNTLDHSVEVGSMSALMAAEIGLDVDVAKRIGLFHDIGKALDEEYQGSHAVAGAQLLKRYGESDAVVNAVAAHHNEVPPETSYAPLLMIADGLSATRPGARAESIDSYIQRVKSLEKLANAMEGVEDAYALQAGREIRVIVHPEKLKEEDARILAQQLRRRIENELQYPGTIKVTVIRERRFTETAT